MAYRARSRSDTDDQVEDAADDEPVGNELERVLVEARDHLDALRAVMQLMHPLPEELNLMAPAMPPVVHEREHQVAEQRTTGDTESISGPDPMLEHPRLPEDAGKPDDAGLN